MHTSNSITKRSTQIVFVIFFTIAFNGFSQSDNLELLKSVLPPSPNSIALGKYAEWPVSLSAGLPNITIPLHELKGRSLSVPISLSYHASGIRVNEIASSVGLGWVINAGGVISRTLRGYPDEITNGFFQFRSRYTDQNNLSSSPVDPFSTYQNVANVADRVADSEQDIYSLIALGISYKLIFKADGSIKTIPFSKIKIKANFISDKFTVTLEDGTVLAFGGSGFLERTQYEEADIAQYTSSWMLKSITSPIGEIINFTYSPVSGISQTASYSEQDRLENSYGLGNGVIPCRCLVPPGGTEPRGSMVQDQAQQGQMLSTIESETVRVELGIASSRQDLNGGKNYTGLKVWSKTKNVYVEEFQFNYSYSDAVGGNTFSSGNNYWLKRLKLNSVNKMDVVLNTPIQKWKFEYDPQNLPSRLSYAQDHWGYYNGALLNTTSLPYVYSTLAVYEGFTPDLYPFGNREPNSAPSQAETLKKITYPTGGYSKFEYESNSYPVSEEQFTPSAKSLELYATSLSNPFQLSKSITFTTTVPQLVTVSIEGSIYGLSDVQTIQLSGSIKNSSGIAVANFGIASPIGNRPTNFSGSSLKYFNLKIPGTYTFAIQSTSVPQGDFGLLDHITLNASVAYKQSIGVQSINKIAGGLRIKSIEDYDLIGSVPLKRTFSYESAVVLRPFSPDIDYVTSFRQQVPQVNFDMWGFPYCDSASMTCLQDYLVRNSVSNSSMIGQIIGYGKVTTSYGVSGENGKTISYFSNNPDEGVTADFPFPSRDSRNWLRGQLLMQTHYDASGKKISRTRNTYATDNAFTITSFKSARNIRYYSYPSTDPHKYAGTLTSQFTLTTALNKQITSTEIVYSGTDSLMTTTNFYYDNANNLRPTRSEMTDSKGNVIRTISRTALEKSDINSAATLSSTASTAIDSMLNKNMITQVIQSEKWLSPDFVTYNIVQRSTTNYKVWYSGPTVVLPENISIKVGTNPPETRVQFSNYDAKGNLREQSKTNDIKKSYVYDYTFSYPIAEIANADFGSVAYTSFESDQNGNWAISSTVRDVLNAWTGKRSFQLSGSTISNSNLNSSKSYVVSLWAKSSTGISINSVAATAGITRNGWTYYEKTVSGVTSVSVSGNGYIDELRLFPVGALMTTYTYEPLVGQTSATDSSNNTTFFEYDGFNRLIGVRDDRGNLLKTYKYNFHQQ